MDFQKTQREDNQVIPKDSLDMRILSSFSKNLNFTFSVHAEPNRSFGEEKSGGFTGMIGQLEREESDLSTIVAPTPGRLKVVDYLRTYPSDPLILTSLKPAVLPAHLSLVRPFAGEVWIGLLIGVVVWVVCFWALQRVWIQGAKGHVVTLHTTLMYGWGVLLEQPPLAPRTRASGQILLASWLVACLIFTTGFKSSLIAHLTVLGTDTPLDTFEDLLMVAADALQKVREGGHTLIDHKNYIRVLVTSRYSNSKGETPFYLSHHGISILATFGWGISAVDFNKNCIRENLCPKSKKNRRTDNNTRTKNLIKKRLQEAQDRFQSATDEREQLWTTFATGQDHIRHTAGEYLQEYRGHQQWIANTRIQKKLTTLHKGPVRNESPAQGFINLSSTTITKEQEILLNLGLNCHYIRRPHPESKRIQIECLIDQLLILRKEKKVAISPTICEELVGEAGRVRGTFRSHLLTRELKQAAKELRQHEDIIIRKGDKYIDDIFVTVSFDEEVPRLITGMESNSCLTFTSERSVDGRLPFLDIDISAWKSVNRPSDKIKEQGIRSIIPTPGSSGSPTNQPQGSLGTLLANGRPAQTANQKPAWTIIPPIRAQVDSRPRWPWGHKYPVLQPKPITHHQTFIQSRTIKAVHPEEASPRGEKLRVSVQSQ
ncbi:hypothetical protein Pmani_002236 [Petrolisthes manimaculis]|uniref:Ionotropic glutamate receptor C-terminal domain-containing protein n=1 Tax=Petrolisthes manimaculis TaxID=1843537 RepID=A0AAE1QJ12_9EUCA|nr:hypothetical protein Pmani_002236 [Petrolisthes manimaculis]